MTEEQTPVDQPAESQPRPRVGMAVLVAIAGLVVAVAAGVVTALVLTDETPVALPVAAPSSSRAVYQPVMFTEEEACALLIPTLDEAVDILLMVQDDQDGSNVDRELLAVTLKRLRDHVDSVPSTMQGDFRVQIETLRQVENLTMGNSHNIDFAKFSASGIAIGTRCRQYAR